MKKNALFAVLLLLFLPLSTVKGQDIDIEKMSTLANNFYAKENYAKSLEIFEKMSDYLLKEKGENDSLYIDCIINQSKCHIRMNNSGKAIETAKKAVNLCKKNKDKNPKLYAFMLDNLGVYYNTNEQHDSAYIYCNEALKVYNELNTNDFHKSVILIHLAETNHFKGDNAKAIANQLQAMSIINDNEGEHSDLYINEAEFLKKYYEANGDKNKAEKLGEKIERLREEVKKGVVDLPKLIEFTSSDVADQHSDDAMRCINYYLSHYANADKMNEAANYIVNWSQACKVVHIVIGDNEYKLINKDKGMAYFVAYLAGCSKYALNTGDPYLSEDLYKSAMIDVINFYVANKKFCGENEFLENFVETYGDGSEKNKEKLFKLINKYYGKTAETNKKFAGK